MDTYMCRNIFAILSPIEVIVFFVLIFRLVLRTRNLCSSEYIIDHFKLHYIKQLKGVKNGIPIVQSAYQMTGVVLAVKILSLDIK